VKEEDENMGSALWRYYEAVEPMLGIADQLEAICPTG
jgi:hypothetical protein